MLHSSMQTFEDGKAMPCPSTPELRMQVFSKKPQLLSTSDAFPDADFYVTTG